MNIAQYLLTIVLVLFTLQISGNNTESKIDSLKILQVINRSESTITISDAQRTQTIGPFCIQAVRYPLDIPFISAREHWDDFVADQPYFPARAIEILSSKGNFALWRDETGITCIRKYTPGQCSTEECKPQVLYSTKHLAKVMIFALCINQKGTPFLKVIPTPEQRTGLAATYAHK
jgi:hypothetical protein